MKQQHLLVPLLIVLLPSALWAAGNKNVNTARNVVELLSKGEYTRVVSRFDDRMKSALPASRLRGAWMTLTGKVGNFQSELGNTATEYKGYDIVVVTCKFQRSYLDVRVVFDGHDRIAGLFFLPHR